jgi:hypothetical protein
MFHRNLLLCITGFERYSEIKMSVNMHAVNVEIPGEDLH